MLFPLISSAVTRLVIGDIVAAADRDVQLRPKAFEVLRYLVENADRLVTKEELIQAIWPNVIVTDEALSHCVSEVRQAIGDGDQAIIKTVPRRGYRSRRPVLRLATGAAAPGTASVSPHISVDCRSLRQPGFAQPLFVYGKVFRPAKRNQMPETGNPQRRIDLA
jgi:DNA-binding winged helix-turn-helix (wHTH) protein